jgi:ketosteroid isomerase-like protein
MKEEQEKNNLVKQELQEIMHEWHQAIFKGERETSARLRADDFISVNPSGDIVTKDEELAVIGSPALVFDSLKTEDVEVRFLDETAVVMGVTDMKAHYNGDEINGRFRYTNVFTRHDGRWQAVVSHATECAS